MFKQIGITRRSFLKGTMLVAGASALGLSGCASTSSSQSASQSSGAVASVSASASASAAAAPIVIGTLATEDILPIWVAQEQGWLDTFNLDVTVVEFQSATELIAGVGSGEVDLAMTDIMVAASMYANGIDVCMEWVTLGTTPEQGRFGIMVGPDSAIESLDQLAGVPIGVGSNTILEYVMDSLLEGAGVPADQIVVEEIQKLPVRYQAMLSGEVAAAALPASLLALGEAQGCRVVADDTTGNNLSQSVMIARSAYAQTSEGAQSIDTLKMAWNESVTGINEDSEAFRQVLVTNANLSEEVAETYPISDYPVCQLPTDAMVDPVLSWMEQKGYLTTPLTYDQATGKFTIA